LNCVKHGNGPSTTSRGGPATPLIVPGGESQSSGLAVGKSASALVGSRSSVPAISVRCAVKLPPNSVGNRWSASTYCCAWIQDGTFIAQSSTLAELGLWSYPAGGKAMNILGPFKDGSVSIYGITVSLRPK